VLFEAVAATVSGPRLTLTEIGRRFGGGSDLRHRIKRTDRLLDNRHLQRDSCAIYAALARMLLTLEDCRTTIAELLDALGPLDKWVASEHDALLTG